MARKFKELKEKMPPEVRARAAAKTKKMLDEMPLDELRAARNLTQESLAKILRVKQSSISKMERRTDMYLSTLAAIIHAMGGELELRAVFSEGSVKINGFREIEQEEEEQRRVVAHAG